MLTDDKGRSADLDDFEVEINDLSPNESRGISNMLLDLGTRFLSRLQNAQVSWQSPEEDEEIDECDFDIRMTDIPLDELLEPSSTDAEEHIFTFGKHLWGKTRNKRLLLVLLLLGLLVPLVSVSPLHNTFTAFFAAPTPQPEQSEAAFGGRRLDNPAALTAVANRTLITRGPNGSVIIIPHSVPQNCPPGSTLGRSHEIGNFPVWLSGLNGGESPIHLPTVTLPSLKGWKGWLVPLHLEVKYHYIGIITLGVVSMYNTPIAQFEDPADKTLTPYLSIDAQRPMNIIGNNGMRQISTWDIALYLPGAGCYAVDAAWPEGHWQISFSAGR